MFYLLRRPTTLRDESNKGFRSEVAEYVWKPYVVVRSCTKIIALLVSAPEIVGRSCIVIIKI